MTTVVNLKNHYYDVFIGRPSKWGNPYSHKKNTTAKYKVKTKKEAIQKYKEWFKTQPDLIHSLSELKDKVLGCYCHPNPCHGDVLIELIDQLEGAEIF
jgi:hypothetical protein